MITEWHQLHPNATPEMLGYIPSFLNENDPTPAREQFNENYIGGWHPFQGFKLNTITLELEYPNDPPTVPLAYAEFRNEVIVVYQHAWVAIIQADGSFEVSRMD